MVRTSPDDDRSAQLVARVQKALLHYGCPDIVATVVGDRTIKLSGLAENANDKAFAVAVARTVPGVSAVTSEVRDRAGDNWRVPKR